MLRSLQLGGSEVLAEMLARGLRDRGHRPTFLTFYEGGDVESVVRQAGFDVVVMGKKSRWELARFFVKFVAALRRLRPDIVYGSLPTANLFCIAAKPFLRGSTVVASHQGSGRDLNSLAWEERANHVLHRRVVRLADRVIVNSDLGRQELVAGGVRSDRIAMIPNGVDVDRFQRDEAGRSRLRSDWKIDAGTVVFALVATRLEPVKGHEVFLNAAAEVKDRIAGARFVCFGNVDTERGAELKRLAAELGVADAMMWVGTHRDMAAVYTAIDVLVLSSFSEGCPNVVFESMACGTPCVVTDVGQCAEMVGDTGIVVPPGRPDELAKGMISMVERLNVDQPGLRRATRSRIMDHFSMTAYVDRVLVAFDQARATRAAGSRRRR